METAERLFADKGYDGTSVRDIADEAEVNVAMISYYFGSREKLLESLFTYRSEASLMKVESMLGNKEVTTLQKVNMLIDYYIDRIQSQPCFHRIMMREQVTNFRTTTAGMISEFKRKNQSLVEQLIHEGQKKGEFKKNIEVPLMMATLIARFLILLLHNIILEKSIIFKPLLTKILISNEKETRYLLKKII
ncbi:MAG: TetR family transcriptional regulator [Ferruginibacter sp.]